MGIALRQPVSSRRSPDASEPSRALTLVPARRRFAWFAISLTVLVSAVMMGAIFLHTRLAERQLQIDQVERSVRTAQEDFDVLRSQRAELRSPTRISESATALGMEIGSESEFVAIDPMVLAITIAQTGQIPAGDEIVVGSDQRLEPLDQFRLVKGVSSEAP
ncbi:MAG: hypothetical protein ABIP17_09385 [Ilumatobacteraceae bacterium]